MLRNNFSFVYVKVYIWCSIQSDSRIYQAFWLAISFCFQIFHKAIFVTIAIVIVIHIAIVVGRCYIIFQKSLFLPKTETFINVWVQGLSVKFLGNNVWAYLWILNSGLWASWRLTFMESWFTHYPNRRRNQIFNK